MLQGRLKAEGKKLGPVTITERSDAIRQKKEHQSVGCGRMRWAFFASFRRVPYTKLGGNSYGEGASDRKGYLRPERAGTFIIYFGLQKGPTGRSDAIHLWLRKSQENVVFSWFIDILKTAKRDAKL